MDQNTRDAFVWICDIFTRADVDFVVSGGFAAKIYGSPRPLYDIDIDLRDEDFHKVAGILHLSQYILFGPTRFIDEQWDIWLLTLNYKGQHIDVCGSSSAKVYSVREKKWVPYPFDIKTSVPMKLFGENVKLISKDALLQYKYLLNRDLDIDDIKNLSSHP